MTDLFAPVTVGKWTLNNRIVMAPMTRNRATPDGIPTSLMATYYTQRATAETHRHRRGAAQRGRTGLHESPGLHTPPNRSKPGAPSPPACTRQAAESSPAHARRTHLPPRQ